MGGGIGCGEAFWRVPKLITNRAFAMVFLRGWGFDLGDQKCEKR